MPFCPECGKSVSPSQKFCRSCGASLIEESPAAVPPAPAFGIPICHSCGASLAPDETFCGNCGTKTGDALAAAVPAPVPVPMQAPAPVPSPVPSPAPVPVQVAVPAPAAPPAGLACPSCGTPLTPDMKFCGSCGALAMAAAPPMAPPPPVYTPPPSPPAAAPAADAILCRACGNPIKPGDKFCSKCLVKVPELPAAAAAGRTPPPAYYQQPPPPTQYIAPAPVLSPAPSGTILCRACGNPIKPGDKFCSKCLVKVPETPRAAAASQAPPPPAAAPTGYICASCGSPVTGSEKFCGICGASIVAARAPAPAPAGAVPPAGKFCGSCGAAISGAGRFCGGCGAPVNASPTAGGETSLHATAPAAAGGEEVMGVIGNARKMKMLGVSWDTYTIVVTNRRMILAQMTQAMLNAAITEAQAKAKAEGKGFFAIMKDQLAAQFQFSLRYETMNPDQALAETPGNKAIDNGRISAIHMKLRDTGSGEMEYIEFKMVIDSADGKFEFMIGEDDRFINLLKSSYGEKVHMPFGYFRTGAVRIKFF